MSCIMQLNTLKKFIKRLPCIKKIENQGGFTLLEILTVVGLFAILVSISFVSYRSVTKGMKFKTLKQSSELFSTALNNCITSSGWEVKRPKGTTVHPCKDSDSAKALEKLDYTCPEDSKCTFHSNDTDGYVCLNVQKKTGARGNKYQLQVIVNREKPKNYKVFCSDKDTNATVENITDSICTDPSTSKYSGCDW